MRVWVGRQVPGLLIQAAQGVLEVKNLLLYDCSILKCDSLNCGGSGLTVDLTDDLGSKFLLKEISHGGLWQTPITIEVEAAVMGTHSLALQLS